MIGKRKKNSIIPSWKSDFLTNDSLAPTWGVGQGEKSGATTFYVAKKVNDKRCLSSIVVTI
jgi:hypothetical protein